MRLVSSLTVAALVAIPTLALAQPTGADPSAASPSSGAESSSGESSGAAASSSAGAAKVTTGLPVKDKTGTTIGSVTEVKKEASGNRVATIKMGADKFAVDTSALAVENGAAVINATQSEIKAMIPKHK